MSLVELMNMLVIPDQIIPILAEEVYRQDTKFKNYIVDSITRFPYPHIAENEKMSAESQKAGKCNIGVYFVMGLSDIYPPQNN